MDKDLYLVSRKTEKEVTTALRRASYHIKGKAFDEISNYSVADEGTLPNVENVEDDSAKFNKLLKDNKLNEFYRKRKKSMELI